MFTSIFAEDTPVMVRFPRTTEEERGNRDNWPWLTGTIVGQCGLDEWQVCVEDIRGRPQGRQQAHSPDATEPALLSDVLPGLQRD